MDAERKNGRYKRRNGRENRKQDRSWRRRRGTGRMKTWGWKNKSAELGD
jgi:hypothetical protein